MKSKIRSERASLSVGGSCEFSNGCICGRDVGSLRGSNCNLGGRPDMNAEYRSLLLTLEVSELKE